ncbi:2-C-methyl-D-erythritol 4-phosphate cytidylyltransferase, partial [Escherichia coli]|uniref:2-C-methyl-D-erythritol 4-phosphate cytidylyltransferase n=1 Tax=Escherichia coli TaxID=562 RepID=UPI0014858D9E
GEERADSVLAGLKAAGDAQWVLVHDAARPCLHQDDLSRLLAFSETNRPGGILASPVSDGKKRSEPGKDPIHQTLSLITIPEATAQRDMREGGSREKKKKK